MPSLGPSDSVSQHTVDRAIDNLLEHVEPPSMHPRFLPISVLWDYKDCEKDTSQGVILTASNKYQPRMSHAICCQDGTMVPSQEYERIQHSADIVVQRLINSTIRTLVLPCTPPCPGPRPSSRRRSRRSTIKPSLSLKHSN